MLSAQGFIKYFVCVTMKDENDERKRFYKVISVQSPMDKNLMVLSWLFHLTVRSTSPVFS